MIDGSEYLPSTYDWVREQVDNYEGSNGREGTTLRDTGLPVIIITMRGRKSRKIRKSPVMRVEYAHQYALVASKGGSDHHPDWYYNLLSDPTEVYIQDGANKFPVTIRELSGDERTIWWNRAVTAYSPYADYQSKTTRLIPVILATPH
ncbi:MAG: nitroreductase family deazaflavin-dependent oxidoreductase [Firmicutes bacterium]|jgi:deazaflavin-dependent oxidoreductase (nitroreductase family)|nr:nitroreductase family deazaflavin-dependent oxidoreductase [Bacillota bacterium]